MSCHAVLLYAIGRIYMRAIGRIYIRAYRTYVFVNLGTHVGYMVRYIASDRIAVLCCIVLCCVYCVVCCGMLYCIA